MAEKLSERSIDFQDRVEAHSDGELELSYAQEAEIGRLSLDDDRDRASEELKDQEHRIEEIQGEVRDLNSKSEAYLRLGEEIRSLETESDAPGMQYVIEASALAMAKGDKKLLRKSIASRDKILGQYNFESDEQRALLKKGIESQVKAHTEYYRKEENLESVKLSPEDSKFSKGEYYSSLESSLADLRGEDGQSGQLREASDKSKQLRSAIEEIEEERSEYLRQENGLAPESEFKHMEEMDLIELSSEVTEAYRTDDLTRLGDAEDMMKKRLEEKYPNDVKKQEQLFDRYYNLAQNDLDRLEKISAAETEEERESLPFDVEAFKGGHAERFKGLEYGSLEWRQKVKEVSEEILALEGVSQEDKRALHLDLLEFKDVEEEGSMVEGKPESSKDPEKPEASSVAMGRYEFMVRGKLDGMDNKSDEYKVAVKQLVDGVDNLGGFFTEAQKDELRKRIEAGDFNSLEGKSRHDHLFNEDGSFKVELSNDQMNASREATKDLDLAPQPRSVSEIGKEKQEEVSVTKVASEYGTKKSRKRDKRALGTSGLASSDKKRTNGLLGAFLAWLAK